MNLAPEKPQVEQTQIRKIFLCHQNLTKHQNVNVFAWPVKWTWLSCKYTIVALFNISMVTAFYSPLNHVNIASNNFPVKSFFSGKV